MGSTKRSDADMDMNFRLELVQRACPKQKRSEAAAQLAKTETDPHAFHSKRYLLEHNLESRLAEAMQALLRAKPENPAFFLAEHLEKTAGEYAKLPEAEVHIAGAPTAAEAQTLRSQAQE